MYSGHNEFEVSTKNSQRAIVWVRVLPVAVPEEPWHLSGLAQEMFFVLFILLKKTLVRMKDGWGERESAPQKYWNIV